MLTTRLWDTSYSSYWAFNNYNQLPARPSSPRMSDKQISSPPVKSDCQGQYLYYASAEIESYPMAVTGTKDDAEQSEAGLTSEQGRCPLPSKSFDQDPHQLVAPKLMHCSPTNSQDSSSTFNISSTIAGEHNRNRGPSSGAEQFPFPKLSESSSIYYRSPSRSQLSSAELSETGKDDLNQSSINREVDDEVEDEEGDITEGDLQSHGQIMAQQLAAHRKLKRFRLTHQQTRFLMSEFAKQPHPDAAHRERLAREIPGLSPRQVQVWFQNRRAKIKRLTADDRDRMIRMRAVPDDFDNVQALHSPYGAVRGVTTFISSSNLGPMSSPFGNSVAGSLVMDMRRAPGDSYLSPTGLTPSFGSFELGQSGPMNVSDMASSVSSLYQDRFGASNASSTPPSDVGLRNCGPYWHPGSGNSMDGSAESNKTGLRERQSINGPNWNSRTVPEALHTPLGIYQGGDPALCSSERQAGVPNRQQFRTPVSGGFPSMESRTYSVMGINSDSTMLKEESGQSRAKGPPGTAPGQLMMDFGVSDRYRTAGLVPPNPPAQDRGHALPPLRTNVFSYQTSYSSGPITSPLDTSSGRIFRSPDDKAADYWNSQQLSAPKSPAGECGLIRPIEPSIPDRKVGSEVHHLFEA
ncbi:hypothetical protein E4U43_007297 [Claviceps pusilla]|uniref:Homeobox domain-containing protein n=1 Tax=Claviceps pusilla TaxID=123648 RepID=A0A9P7T0P1_9HYPO|nr:hypothetical protein E4U43_007297 [Claviceps pusilla]